MNYYTKTLIEYINASEKQKAEIERKARLKKIRSIQGFSRKEYNKIISV